MPLSKFSTEELAELKKEFDSLDTIEEKYKFFNKSFKKFYTDVGRLYPTDLFKDFEIHPKNDEENEELNLLQLEEIKWVRFHFVSRKDRRDNFDLENEIQQLNGKLLGVIKPLPILEKELEWIQSEVKRNETQLTGLEPDLLIKYKDRDELSWENTARRFCNYGYENFYLKGLEPDLKHNNYWGFTLLYLNIGYEIAKYRLFIEKKIEEVENKQTPLAQEETSLKRQLLILFYSGMLDSLSKIPNKDRNKLLSMLLNRSEQSIKQDLTNIHKKSKTYRIRTEENYSFLFDLFNEVGLNEKAEEIKRELDKLREEKK